MATLRYGIGMLALVLLAACGGGDGDGGGVGVGGASGSGGASPAPTQTATGSDPGQAFCTEFCETMAAAHCPNDDTCVAQCVLDTERFPDCDAEQEAAYQCLLTAPPPALECNGLGNAQLSQGATLCSAERAALGECYLAAL